MLVTLGCAGLPGAGGDRAQRGDPRVAPGRAECDTQQGQGAETCWWDLGPWRAVSGSSLHPSGCVPSYPTLCPCPSGTAGVWWPQDLLLKLSKRVQVMPGTNQLSSLGQNVRGECVFPKGNWSRNTGVRRSCLVKIVNKHS